MLADVVQMHEVVICALLQILVDGKLFHLKNGILEWDKKEIVSSNLNHEL